MHPAFNDRASCSGIGLLCFVYCGFLELSRLSPQRLYTREAVKPQHDFAKLQVDLLLPMQ